jgi:hypothetical protein
MKMPGEMSYLCHHVLKFAIWVSKDQAKYFHDSNSSAFQKAVFEILYENMPFVESERSVGIKSESYSLPLRQQLFGQRRFR